MIGRDYYLKLEQGIYFQDSLIKENSRFKDEYVKKEESGDKDLIIYDIEFYKEKNGNFRYKIIGIKGVPKDKEKKGWINRTNKKLTVNKSGEKVETWTYNKHNEAQRIALNIKHRLEN